MKILVWILFLSVGVTFGQQGLTFPSIKGHSLEDKAVKVPALNGKYSVIGIAFHREAEDALKKWLNPLFNTFIRTEKTSAAEFDVADVYDVNFVFIPLISGFKRVADDFKKKTDPHYWSYIMDTEKTDVEVLRSSLGVKDQKIPYFFVLDPSGKVLSFQSGNYSEQKLDKLEDAIE